MAITYHTLPYHTAPYHTIPYIIPYVPYHNRMIQYISYLHIIPYHNIPPPKKAKFQWPVCFQNLKHGWNSSRAGRLYLPISGWDRSWTSCKQFLFSPRDERHPGMKRIYSLIYTKYQNQLTLLATVFVRKNRFVTKSTSGWIPQGLTVSIEGTTVFPETQILYFSLTA